MSWDFMVIYIRVIGFEISCDFLGMSWDFRAMDQAKKGQGRLDEPEEGEEKAGHCSTLK